MYIKMPTPQRSHVKTVITFICLWLLIAYLYSREAEGQYTEESRVAYCEENWATIFSRCID